MRKVVADGPEILVNLGLDIWLVEVAELWYKLAVKNEAAGDCFKSKDAGFALQ
jgi:hypothetical protein